MLHLRVLLKKPIGLGRQAVVEAWIRVHLHLQQHHRKLWTAGFGAARGFHRPEHAVQAVAQLLDLKGLKAIDAITGGRWVEAQFAGKSCF